MKSITRLTVLTVFVLAIGLFATPANAQVSFGVNIQIGQPVYPGQTPYPVVPVDSYGPPTCNWGYYDYYPYACAPQGYYGPEYFVSNGPSTRIFVGVGPWRSWYQRFPHYYDRSPRYRNDWHGQRWSVNTRQDFERRSHYQAPVRVEPHQRTYVDQQRWEQQRRDQHRNDQRGHDNQGQHRNDQRGHDDQGQRHNDQRGHDDQGQRHNHDNQEQHRDR